MQNLAHHISPLPTAAIVTGLSVLFSSAGNFVAPAAVINNRTLADFAERAACSMVQSLLE
jgi:hypothetical protein